jgi:very-short-patch-repair endonuclease
MKNNKLTTEEFINRAKCVHGDKYDYSLIDYKNMFSKIRVICLKHGEFVKEAKSFLKGGGCKKCFDEKRGESQRLTTKDFIKRAKGVHGNKYDYSLVEYKNSKTKIKIICKEHGEFIQTPGKHLKGQGCKKCSYKEVGISQRLTTEKFIEKARVIHGDKYDYSLTEVINSSNKIKIICPEHGIWEQKPNGHLQGKGCRTCSGYKKLTTEEFIKKAGDVHEGKYDYSFVNYEGHYKKVKIICPEHGEFIQGAGSHLAGTGCPRCSESKGEKEIYKWLLNKELNFTRQKTFNNCKHKRQLYFDFYVIDHNLCIEYDGKQHFEPIEYFGGKLTLEEIKKRDKFKNKFCNKHNINLLRINYEEDIIKKLEKWYEQEVEKS